MKNYWELRGKNWEGYKIDESEQWQLDIKEEEERQNWTKKKTSGGLPKCQKPIFRKPKTLFYGRKPGGVQ